MTFAAVGSPVTATAATFTLTPNGTGNFLLLEVISETAADYATALSSSNVTWSVLVAHTSLSANAVVSTLFLGHVTSTAAETVTVTLAAGSPTLRISGQEFSTTAGFSAVTVDTSGTVNAATTLCPDLTPAHGAGELYFYYGFNSATATAGTTSGYTYAIDANGNGMVYDADCTSSAQEPAWGASDTISGIAVLLYEASAALTASASLTVAPSFAATASGSEGRTTASLTVTPVLTPAAHGAHVASAALTITPTFAATAVVTGLVQETSGSTTGTTLTLTFPAAITQGHALIIAMCGFPSGSVSSIAVGGTVDTFIQAVATTTNSCQIWANYSVGQSSATVAITTSVAGIIAWAYEVAGSVELDTSAENTGTGTSWSSGASGTTIPYYGHLIIGLGTTVSAGSITGPASGWTNESAITDIATASGHAGGVSGWRQGVAATTYDYSGTAADSSAWGAVTAAFLVLGAGSSITGSYQPGWSGYVFGEHVGYTGITATFTVPEITGGESVSVWVGLGNVYQCGIYLTYDTSASDNTSIFTWTEMLPGGGYEWDATTYPVAVGDTLTCSMELTSTDWLLTIANQTEGWSYTDVKSVLSINIGSISNAGAGPADWPYPITTAEVIIEDEDHAECANYGSIAFTSVTTTPAATELPPPVITVNTAVAQYPGPYNLADGSFTMFWNSYN